MERRKRQTISTRILPCECCKFPITHRHHLIEFSKYGEGITVSLCGSCHDIYHIFQNAHLHPTKYNLYLYAYITKYFGIEHPHVLFFLNLFKQHIDLRNEKTIECINYDFDYSEEEVESWI